MKLNKNYNLKLVVMVIMTFIGFATVFAQNSTVSGTVSDKAGPLVGVTVLVTGTGTGTITDADGNFSVNAAPNATLRISFLGYLPQEIPLNGRKTIQVTLTEDTKQLEEVVVVGYGVVKKSDLTGAVGSVQAKDLTFPASNLSEMLRGKVAGVQVNLTSGRPGASSNMYIRGQRSLSADNTPLYIVDGVQVESMNAINPNDIASIDILKDASSQAIYGARAANGVVMITTKRGVVGKLQINLDTYWSTESLWKNFTEYTGDEFYELRWQAKRTYYGYTDDQRTPDNVLNDPLMESVWAKRQFADWGKLMFKNALSQKYDLSIRGATEKMKYALMAGFYGQGGIVVKTGFQRVNFRANADYDATSFLTVGTNLSFIKSWQQIEDGGGNENGSTGSFELYLTRPPIAKVFNDDGSYAPIINSEGLENPIYQAQYADHKVVSDRLDMNLYLNFKLFKGLTYKLNTSYRTRFSEEGVYRTSLYSSRTPFGSGTLTNTYFNNALLENILTYDTKFNTDKHHLTLTFVQSMEQSGTKTLGIGGSQLPVDFFEWNGLPDAAALTQPVRHITDESYLSFLGRINYAFMDKYLFTASIRRDGASVFGENHKWGNFPSAAVAWKLSEEKFIKPLEWISNLKLRVTYGLVGNKAIPPYRALGLTNSYAMRFGDDKLIMGYSPTTELTNPNLRWESTASLNTGLDFGFLNSRISGSIDHFNTTTNDLLIKKSITATSGYSTMWDNLAETRTTGWEIALGGDLFRTKDFNWRIDATYSSARSKIIKLNGLLDEFGKPANDIDNGWFIGMPINVYFGYVFDGIWQLSDDKNGDGFIDNTVDTNGDGIPDRQFMTNAKPGDVRVKDINGDGYITPDDRTPRSREPNWMGSLSTSVAYKGFDLYAELYTVQGILRSNSYLRGTNLQGKLNAIKVNYWTPENPSNEYPRPNYVNTDQYNSALGFQDGSYIRLRSVILGYTLPQNLTRKFAVEKLRFYCSATNLWTKTKYLSYNPELNPNEYPESRQYLFGINVQF